MAVNKGTHCRQEGKGQGRKKLRLFEITEGGIPEEVILLTEEVVRECRNRCEWDRPVQELWNVKEVHCVRERWLKKSMCGD